MYGLPLLLALLIFMVGVVVFRKREKQEKMLLVSAVIFGIHLRVVLVLSAFKVLRIPMVRFFDNAGGAIAGAMFSSATGMAPLLYFGIALTCAGVWGAMERAQSNCFYTKASIGLCLSSGFAKEVRRLLHEHPVHIGYVLRGLGAWYVLMALLWPLAY